MGKYFRYVKQPLRPEIAYKYIRERVVKELQIVGQAHVYERQQIVQNFKHKPQWGFDVQITAKELRLRILLKNPDTPVRGDFTIADLWHALDETGVKPHLMGPIFPKTKKALAFKVGGHYRPKTNPGGRFRGPGKVQGGKTVIAQSTKRFTHPGFKPRHFTRRINKDLRRLFLTQAERGYRLGHQQALFRNR